MTTAALAPSIEYLENGVGLAFAVPFRFLTAAHLQAKRIAADGTVTTLTLGVHYSVVGGSTDAGGTLTLFASTAGARLKIRRVTSRAQATDYGTTDTFPAETHEAALDRLSLVDQEIDVDVADIRARGVFAPEGQIGWTVPISATARAGMIVGFAAADGAAALLDGAAFRGPPGTASASSQLNIDALATSTFATWQFHRARMARLSMTAPVQVNNFNVSVQVAEAFSPAGKCTSWYFGPNVQVGGGRENATYSATYLFIEENFQETGRPTATEIHAGHNGLDGTHQRPISMYCPVAGAIAGQFTYVQHGEFSHLDWITSALRWHSTELAAGVGQQIYEASEQFVYKRLGGAFVQFHNGGQAPLPYIVAATGRTKLSEGVSETDSDLFVGRYVRVGIADYYPEVTVGGGGSDIPTINLNANNGAGVSALYARLLVSRNQTAGEQFRIETTDTAINLGTAATTWGKAEAVGLRSTASLIPATNTVATLPTPTGALVGALRFASNARNAGEGAAAGTGATVECTGSIWKIPGIAGAVAA